MTLLITTIAAAVCTAVWYKNADKNELRLDVPCWMFWGASIMWFVDAVAEYLEIGAEYFTPSATDMLNDSYLGLSVVALGLVIWLVILLIKDPKGKIKKMLSNK